MTAADPLQPVAPEYAISNFYRTVTLIFIAALSVSAALHAVLLMSDSPDYRQWVYVQIGAQLVGITLLWGMLRYKTIALFLLFPLSVVFTYINAVYTNYGHTNENIVGFAVLWLVYGVLIGKSWGKFRSNHAAGV